MGTNTGAIGRGPRDATTHPGRHASRPAAIQPTPEAATTLTSPAPADAQHTSPEKGAVALRFRGTTFDPALAPLPPLPLPRPSDPAAELPSIAEAPRWSPVAIAVPLFVAVWICFAALAASVSSPPTADIAALGHVLATGAAVVGLVFVTLSVVHIQVSGLRPRPAVVAVVALGLGQGLVAARVGSDPFGLWPIGAQMFVLIGLAVPLAWVGGQFQRGVRRQRVERHASLTASWIERARRQAHQTVESVHRHDVRSMLFVIDGAARTMVDDRLSADQRASFGEMLADGVQRLSALMDVRSAEIQPFAVDGVARAVVHAERKAGRLAFADLPAPVHAVGRAADVAAVLRTLVTVAARNGAGSVELRSAVEAGLVVVQVAPAGAEPLPMLTGNWEEIWTESFKSSRNGDEDSVDLYVAARLLTEQGADLWSTAGRARFAVRLPAVADPSSQEEV